MIKSGRIRKSLRFLDQEYNRYFRDADKERPVLFAKMAVLEYCGWLEESFDEIAKNGVQKKLRTAMRRHILEKKIEETYGFSYKGKVQPLLAFKLGTVRLLEVEKQLSRDGSLDRLKSHLGTMKKMRDEAAHTYISGRTSHFQAPSVILADFEQIKNILKKLWELACL